MITFEEFLAETSYTPAYAARAVLYLPDSRPALLAKKFKLDVAGQKKIMTSVCASKTKIVSSVKTSSKQPTKLETASPQLDLVENAKSKAMDNAA